MPTLLYCLKFGLIFFIFSVMIGQIYFEMEWHEWNNQNQTLRNDLKNGEISCFKVDVLRDTQLAGSKNLQIIISTFLFHCINFFVHFL